MKDGGLVESRIHVAQPLPALLLLQLFGEVVAGLFDRDLHLSWYDHARAMAAT
jgi:hypothetical protein